MGELGPVVVAAGAALLSSVACASGGLVGEDDATSGAPTGGAITPTTSGTGGASGGSSSGGAGGVGGDAGSGATGGVGAEGGLGGSSPAGGAGGSAAGGGGSGGAGTGGGIVGDTTAPEVDAISPDDGALAIAKLPTISVTFSEPMNAGTLTTGTTTLCAGTLQVSSNGFSTCVPMVGPPVTVDGETFAVTPAVPLSSLESYQIRVTTGASDLAGNSLASVFSTPAGFTVRFFHTVTIDGVNDFDPATDAIATTTAGAQLFVTHDETTLFVGLSSPAIVVGGSGNKFVYFLFSTDVQLATGHPLSSDGKAKFGASSQMAYHYKERIDGPAYSEFRIGDGAGWATDWGASGKSSFRGAGFLEASISLSELGGAPPSSVLVTAYTVDYDGAGGDGWLFNLLAGAADGSAATPRDLVTYLELGLPAAAAPNAPQKLSSF